jgi:lipoprotein-anchoring transpeptidase ErfK/SrfK
MRFFEVAALTLLALATPHEAPASEPDALTLQAINTAAFLAASPPPAPASAPDPVIIREEVLLDRARFSPGVIDGLGGANESRALAAFQAHAHLKPTGKLDAASWLALTAGDAPVVKPYVITLADVAGPFAPDEGEDFVKLAALPDGPQYSTPLEGLAERAHMSQSLMQALNPGADFSKPGTALLIAASDTPDFTKGEVHSIEVSKAKAQVTAFAADGAILAVYPATVGSTERPSPSGVHKIVGVAYNTDYVYDPSKLHWGPHAHGRFRIKPGPKGPVGVVWIDLNAPSYGIHGSPDPNLIGKTASHGCVRLTNWDALALAHGVKPGVVVTFLGKRPARADRAR